MRAYETTGVIAYVQRAAQIFDYVIDNAWTAQCGGGVLWCPENPGTDGYKNAMCVLLFDALPLGVRALSKASFTVSVPYLPTFLAPSLFAAQTSYFSRQP